MKNAAIAVTLIALGLCITSGPRALAQKTQKRAVPVRTYIEGTGAESDPTVFSYRIQSDLSGAYQHGIDSVVSELQTGGDWQLSTLESPTRTVSLDFRDPVPNSNASPPFLLAQVPAKVETKSYALYGNGKVSGMTGLNSTLLTPFLVRFDFNGNTYRIWMNTRSYSETNYAVVTCTGVADPTMPATSQCTQWKIEPDATQADGQKKNVARLVRFYTSKGKTIEEDLGDFYMSFALSMTNP